MSGPTPVPKFSSFRPKSRPKAVQPPDSPTTIQESRLNRVSEPRQHIHDGFKQGDEQIRDHHDRGNQSLHSRNHYGRSGPGTHRHIRSPQAQSDHNRRVTTTVSKVADEFHESDCFIVDRRGDSKNLAYGNLHRYSIPAYNRTGYGRIIGALGGAKIDRNSSDEKSVVLVSASPKPAGRHERVLTSKRGMLVRKSLRIIPSATGSFFHDPDSDFITLRSGHKRRKVSPTPALNERTHEVDYRSVDGKAKPRKASISDDDLESASDVDHMIDHSLVHRQENAVLSRKTKANPTDLGAWLSLVEHQKKLVNPDKDVSTFSANERHILADLRVSILNEAAGTIAKGKAGRQQLLLAMLEEGRHFWDSSKLESKWKEALLESPTSSLLWTKYLDYVQLDHRAFRYEGCKDTYLRCLKIVHDARENSVGEAVEVDSTLIDVLLRYTAFVRDAGYFELGVAIWQAVIELSFCTAADDSLECFGEFWDSEVPRVGEENARGWKSAHAEGNALQRATLPYVVSELDKSEPLQSVIAEEARLADIFNMPASIDDLSQATDPFRCVMFSDLQSVLSCVGSKLPKSLILDALFCFFGLPPLPHSHGHVISAWWSNPYLRSIKLAQSGSNSLSIPEEVVLRYQVESIEGLFDSAFESFAASADSGSKRFVDRLLATLVDTQDNDDILAIYLLAYKTRFFPDEARKVAKRLLKIRTSSLLLYDAYALAEASDGKLEKARAVWDAAIGMRLSLPETAQDEVILLHHNAALTHIEHGEDIRAFRYLLPTSINQSNILTSDTAINISRMLSAKRQLIDGFDRMMLKRKWCLAVYYADCLAWLEYYTCQNNLAAALTLYGEYARILETQAVSSAHELLLQAKARLITTHLNSRRPFKPAVINDEIRADLHTFSSNSVLLRLQRRLAGHDRLRVLVQEQKNPVASTSLILWSSKLAGELARSAVDYTGSTANTVRAVFVNILAENDTLQHAPFFWQTWFLFETYQGKQGNAKQVLLDGLRKIPWHKNFAIQSMRHFTESGDLSQTELMQIYETLIERGLRVRVDFEM